MISYAEMIAHACQSVHVPVVAWPEYVEPKKRVRFDRRDPNAVRLKILQLLSNGASMTAREIRDEISGPLETTRTNLCSMLKRKEIRSFKRPVEKSKPINVYSMKAEKCNLH